MRTWGLEIQCAEPRHYSSSLTAVRLPEGHSADGLRAAIDLVYRANVRAATARPDAS